MDVLHETVPYHQHAHCMASMKHSALIRYTCIEHKDLLRIIWLRCNIRGSSGHDVQQELHSAGRILSLPCA